MILRSLFRPIVFSAVLAGAVVVTPQVLCAAQTQPTNPSAQSLLHKAEVEARAGHKSILVEFGASWCVNCHLYERMLATPQMHAILSRYFVFLPMDTGEMPTSLRHQNTPGGTALEDSIGGKGAGWPYIAVLNDRGQLLINSMRPDAKAAGGHTNIGYPVMPQEIDWFMTMLRRGAPKMTASEQTQVRNWLEAEAKKIS